MNCKIKPIYDAIKWYVREKFTCTKHGVMEAILVPLEVSSDIGNNYLFIFDIQR